MKQSNNDRNNKGDLVVERCIDTNNDDSETMSKAIFTEETSLLWQEIKEEAMKSIEQQNIERDSLRSEDEMSAIAELEIKRKINLKMKRRDSRAIAVTKRLNNVENQEEEKLHFNLQATTLTPLCKDIGTETIEEENPISTYFNANDLFDFSTLKTKSDSLNNWSRGVSNIKLKREKVKLQRLVLVKNGVEMQEDDFVLLEISEKPTERKSKDPLKLNISRNSANGTPLMPLNRSRNKDADNDYSTYKEFIQNNKYQIKKDLPNRPFVSLKKHMIARVSFRISDTSCLVDVYGNMGRLFGGKGAGQNIQMEIFSFWNSQKYSLSFTIGDVRRLFIDRPDLIKAGCKKKIIDGLLKRLYFKYTVTATPPRDLDDKSVHVIEVTHLERPKFPSFLHASSIMDVITVIQDGQELVHFPLPILEQELKIGVEERPNGLVKRLSEYKETQRQLDEVEKTKAERWFATPKRLRGYLCSTLIRLKGHFVMVSTYRMPDRPNNIIVKGVKAITCTKIGHFLGLPYLGQIFNIKQNSKNWDEDYIKSVVRKALRSMTLSAKVVFDEIRRKEYSLCIVDNNGTGVDFDEKSINRRRAFRLDTTRIHTTSDSFLNLKIPFLTCLPRRHIGTTHLTTRSIKINQVYCIYSVYIRKELTVEDESSFKSENKKAFTSEAFALDFEIYIPDDAYFKGSLIPGQSSFKITLDKHDVVFFTEATNLPILKSSLRHFFLNSDKDIVEEVKSNWQFLCAQLMARMQFRLRWHSSTATTVHEANQKMFIDARNTIEKPFDEGTIVCLSFRIGVVINKTVLIQSMDDSRQKPYVQASLWISGKSMGVIIYDFVKKNVYFLAPSQAIQDNQIELLREISSKDRVFQASMFLQFSLVLACVFDELTGEQCGSEVQWVNSE